MRGRKLSKPSKEGRTVGAKVGTGVGTKEGESVGADVGREVGIGEGSMRAA